MDNDRCAICGEKIRVKYYRDPWGNKACEFHERKQCSCCHRFIGRYSTYSQKTKQIGFNLMDGRYVCGLCQETSVVDLEQVGKSAEFVMALLDKAGFNIPHGKVTVSLISKDEMEKISPGARGLCRRQFYTGEPERTTAKILIHHGLPKVLFESVLAHELLHFWLRYNGIMDSEDEEGFCNVGSALILNYYAARQGDKLAEYMRTLTNENPDYYYGVKFLEQKKKLQDMGWKEYVETMLKSKKL